MNIEFYTRHFLKLGNRTCTDSRVAKCIPLWWYNTRLKKEGGLRLTDGGYEYLIDQLDIRSYKIAWPPDLAKKNSVYLFLDRNIQSPYHISKYWITLFAEQDALIVALLMSDASKYGWNRAKGRRLKSMIPLELYEKHEPRYKTVKKKKPRTKKKSTKVVDKHKKKD